MNELKLSIERQFENIARMLYRHPKTALIFTLLLVAPLIYPVKDISFESSNHKMLRHNDSILIDYRDFTYQFGRSSLIVAAVESPEVFSPAFLKKLKAFHEDLQKNIPYIQRVESLINARYTRVDGDTLMSEDLLKGWPEKNVDMNEIKTAVLSNPAFENMLISEDGRMTAVVLEVQALEHDDEPQEIRVDDFGEETFIDKDSTEKLFRVNAPIIKEMAQAMRTVVERHRSPDFPIYVSGDIMLADIYNREVKRNMSRNFLLGTGIVILFLGLLFKRVTGVIFPTLVIDLSVLTTLGLMSLNGVSITDTTMIIPAFLLTVGIGDSVHILAIFYRQLSLGDSKEEATVYAFGHSGLAISLTSLTTAAGLLSFSMADLQALVDMGFYSAAGVVMAFFATLLILPPLLSLAPIKRKRRKEIEKKSHTMDRFLLSFAHFSTTYPKQIVLTAIFLFIGAGLLISQLRFSHYQLMYIPNTSNVKSDIEYIDKRLKGVSTLEIVIDTKEVDGLKSPEMLYMIETVTEWIKALQNDEIVIGHIFSIVDIVKEINKAFHENDAAYYEIPEDRPTISQELFLFETANQSNDLAKVVDSQFSKARITVKLASADAIFYREFIHKVKNMLEETFHGRAGIVITGNVAVMARIVPATMKSMVESYIIAFIVITILMIMLVGNLKIGLSSMIPNLMPIVITMGIMVLLGDSLNLVTVMIGSIAIGLVVDDTIHFIYNFQRAFEESGDPVGALHYTFLGTGRAMLFTSIILSLGFFVLLLSSMAHMRMFGGYTGIVIILALLSDFIIAPSLLFLIAQRKDVSNGKRFKTVQVGA